MLVSKGNYLFDGVEEKVSKKGYSYRIVKIIDKDNYERLEFFGDEELTINCGQGAPCQFTLLAKRQGYSTAFNMKAVEAVR